MKFTPEEIRDLCTKTGGRYAVAEKDEAFGWCKKLALKHYENFPVGSLFVPAHARPHFYSVYAFSRIADDIADEPGFETSERIALLEMLEEMLTDEMLTSSNPIFKALYYTCTENEIPKQPFLKLLEAFRRDIHFTRPVTWDDVFDYCEHSANPVGELVLRIMGDYSEKTSELSNCICTALQLANFWQDTASDLKRGRNYYPSAQCRGLDFTEDNLCKEEFSAKFNSVLMEAVLVTETLFNQGKGIIPLLKGWRLRTEIALTITGGLYINSQVKEIGSDILLRRPALSVRALPSLFYGCLKLLLR